MKTLIRRFYLNKIHRLLSRQNGDFRVSGEYALNRVGPDRELYRSLLFFNKLALKGNDEFRLEAWTHTYCQLAVYEATARQKLRLRKGVELLIERNMHHQLYEDLLFALRDLFKTFSGEELRNELLYSLEKVLVSNRRSLELAIRFLFGFSVHLRTSIRSRRDAENTEKLIKDFCIVFNESKLSLEKIETIAQFLVDHLADLQTGEQSVFSAPRSHLKFKQDIPRLFVKDVANEGVTVE